MFRVFSAVTPAGVKFLDIDIHKPDYQTLKAALELLADDYVILFPADIGVSVLCKADGESCNRLAAITRSSTPLRLAVSEDRDLASLERDDITPYMPDYNTNRAFHTLVQLCDFPLLIARAVGDREAVAENYPEIEYAFWPL